MGRLVADSQRLLRGKRHPSKLIDWMSFIQFNGTVKDAKTPYDWMTRDDEQIRQFIDDPLTGFLCTTQFWHDLMDGLIYVNTAANVEKMPKDLPVYSESWTLYGDQLQHVGIPMNGQFTGTERSEHLSHIGDCGSRIYHIKRQETPLLPDAPGNY